MGVRGLQYYLEQCCQTASPVVSIQDLIENRRRGRRNEQLVIVVDGSSCVRILYGNLEWIGGAQLKQFAEKAQDFVNAFEEIGVRLVFFFDGPTIERKRSTWVERRYTTLEKKVYKALDYLAKGHPSYTINKNCFHLPPGMGQLCRVIFEVFCGCEVYQSLTECDEEIAEYARNHDVFAVLAQDTDYVILNTGQALYLSMERLNLQNMTTRLYDRWELARTLRIHPSQLPLLATFMGNDIVTANDLVKFHREIIQSHNSYIDFRRLVPNLAMYIRRLPLDQNELDEMLPNIAQRIFGNPARAEDISKSLKSYDILSPRDYEREERDRNSQWSRLVSEARRRHQNNRMPSMVYAIMSGLPFECSTSVEDFRRNDLPTFASASQPIRERVYGILLQEKPLPRSGTHTVPEWCMAGPGSLDEVKYVSARPPQRRHPGLLALWNDKGRLSHVRWSLFVHSVSPSLDVERVKNYLPRYMVMPTLIMFFLNELDCLAPWEIDVALATAAVIDYYDAANLAALPSDPISIRGIRVANLYMRFTFILYFLQAACGYPLTIEETAPWLFFDGKLFQTKYIQAEQGSSHLRLCENKADVLEDFQLARRIVFGED